VTKGACPFRYQEARYLGSIQKPACRFSTILKCERGGIVKKKNDENDQVKDEHRLALHAVFETLLLHFVTGVLLLDHFFYVLNLHIFVV